MTKIISCEYLRCQPLFGQITLNYLKVEDNFKNFQSFLKIINLVLEDKRCNTVCFGPKGFFFFVLSSCPHSQHHTSTQLTFSLSLVSFLFPLFFFTWFSLSFYFLFLWQAKSYPLLSPIFSSLMSLFRWWKSFGGGRWVSKFQWDN